MAHAREGVVSSGRSKDGGGPGGLWNARGGAAEGKVVRDWHEERDSCSCKLRIPRQPSGYLQWGRSTYTALELKKMYCSCVYVCV